MQMTYAAQRRDLRTLTAVARSLDLHPSTLASAVDRESVPGPNVRVGKRTYYNAAQAEAVAAEVAAGREHGYFPRTTGRGGDHE